MDPQASQTPQEVPPQTITTTHTVVETTTQTARPTGQSAKQPKNSNSYFEILKFAFIVIIIFVPIRLFVAKPFIVSGLSMYPTFNNNQYLIVDELTYHFETPQRGDVVVFEYPLNTSLYYIKRIIGLPGDTVTSKNNVITISNAAKGYSFVLSEPYLTGVTTSDFTAVVAPNSYFVLGDNRPVSSDSRYWGDVPANLIVGRPVIRLFPPTSIGIFPGAASEPQN